jgi:hypothetical protein
VAPKSAKIEALSSLCTSRISRESHFGELLIRLSHVHSLVVVNIRPRNHAGQRGMSSLLSVQLLLYLTLSGRVDLDVCKVHIFSLRLFPDLTS